MLIVKEILIWYGTLATIITVVAMTVAVRRFYIRKDGP